MPYRKNHYVPEFYLKSFSVVHNGERNPALWVYDKDDPAKSRKQSPRDTAAINDLYRLTAPGAGVAENALELAFAHQESAVSPILSRWQSPDAILTIAEIPAVAYFLALLHLRNPKSAKFVEEASQVVEVERIKTLARDDERFDIFWQRCLEQISKEEFRAIALNVDEHFIIRPDRKYSTLAPLAHADAVFQELKTMYWCLCVSSGDREFITSDSPVVVRFRDKSGVAYGNGFGHPNAQVTFPISPRVCLYLSRDCTWKTLPVGSTFVKNANQRTAINAERYVFTTTQSQGIEKLVVKYAVTRQHPKVNKDEMIEDIRLRARQNKKTD